MFFQSYVKMSIISTVLFTLSACGTSVKSERGCIYLEDCELSEYCERSVCIALKECGVDNKVKYCLENDVRRLSQ